MSARHPAVPRAAIGALAMLLAAAGPSPINTPGDRLGTALDVADFIAPGLHAGPGALAALSHTHGRQAPRPLSDPRLRWSAAYVHAKPARGLPPYVPPSRPLPAFSWLHGELATYPNADAIAAGGGSPFSIADGAFRITAAPPADQMRALIPADYPADYVSGAIISYPFCQTYGYFEMTARVPHGRGLWPAFWLLPMNLDWPPEIDAMEVLGHQTDRVVTTVHSKQIGKPSYQALTTVTADLAAGFHRYGVDWGPQAIRFYLDRKLVFSEPTPGDMHQPFYLLANLAVGGPRSWPGAPDAAAVFPAHFDILEIAAWQRRAYLADAAGR